MQITADSLAALAKKSFLVSFSIIPVLLRLNVIQLLMSSFFG